MPPTANTLAPRFDAQNPANRTGEFPMREEYFEQPQGGYDSPEVRDEVDTRTDEKHWGHLQEQAKNMAPLSTSVTVGGGQEQPTVSPVREGINNNAEMARREVGVDAAAVVAVREATLPPTTEAQRNAAKWN
jgi:hypothetical protein